MALYSNDTSIAKVNNSKELPCLNILSVDFDWIMAPSIEMYNRMTNMTSPDWQKMQEQCPGVSLPCDLNKYEDLCIYLGNIIANIPNTICFRYGFDHNEILNVFRLWNIGNQRYNLYNIDHHHDCGYCSKDNSTYEDFLDTPGCANWMLHLLKEHPNCQQYTWIKNENSLDGIHEIVKPKLPKVIETTDIAVIDPIYFDYIFLCKSEPWVPATYWPLYDSLTHLLEKIIIK